MHPPDHDFPAPARSAPASAPASGPLSRIPRGFSLIEITLALGIISFAGMTILGLLSSALGTLQESSFDLVAARIAADTRADLQQVELAGSAPQVLHYTPEGRVVPAGNPEGVFEVYRSETPHPVPGQSTGRLRRVAVQIVHNPSHTPLPVDAQGRANLPPEMPSKTFRFYVAR